MDHIHENKPLRIAELPVGSNGGILGLSLAPGKCGPSSFGGHHRRDLRSDMDRICDWGAVAVVTLMETDELARFQIAGLGEEARNRFMEWHHLPIIDGQVPCERFESEWPQASRSLRGLLEAGNRIFVHCLGGLGRAGSVSARLLVEMGEDHEIAIGQIRATRSRYAIETQGQADWVRRGRALPFRPHASDPRDRAIGAMVGLAIGDAVGTAIEFSAKPSRPTIHDMVGGGPFDLAAGQWTDDTSMALALADSLLHDPALDPKDLMNRFVRWWKEGVYSCTGQCFDIGTTTSAALLRYLRTGDPLAGDSRPDSSGNGCIMRLAPVAVRHWNDHDALRHVAEVQARTTHATDECVEYSVLLARIIADAIEGEPFQELVTGNIAKSVRGYRLGQPRSEVRGSGYVVHCLHAALWAVGRTTSFENAVLMASNLGEDADTTAAVTGQIAGAIYGLSGIPESWLEKLAWRERIEQQASQLFDKSKSCDGGVPS